jgi:hypothetical protein
MEKIILLLIVILTLAFNKKVETKTSRPTQEIKYITAKSGLIYRDKPKGKRLGKFEFNEKIINTEHSYIFQEIKMGNENVKDKWLDKEVDNKSIYVFASSIPDTEIKITSEDIKRFMGNYVWISQDFKNVLEETKLLSKASNYGGFVNLFYWENNLYCHTKYSENDETYDPSRIIEINNKNLKLKYEQKIFAFEKTNIRVDYDGFLFNPPIKCTDQVFGEWFSGNYLFKNENGTKTYNSKFINYYLFWEDDIIEISSKKYEIDKVVGNTYYLSEIEFVGEEGDETIEQKGEKATLTKIKS